MENKCYFCDSTDTTYCSVCGHYFCDNCRKNKSKRIVAMAKEWCKKMGWGEFLTPEEVEERKKKESNH